MFENSLDNTCLVGMDFETADMGKDSACAIGMVKIKNGTITDTFYSPIKPPRRRVLFTHIHGFTWEMLKDKPTFAELWGDIHNFLENVDGIIAHNASFDRGVFYGTSQMYGIDAPLFPFYCTLKMARQNLQLKNNKLSDVCSSLGIELDHHNAMSDAHATSKIFLHCAKQSYNLQACRLKELKR